MNLGFGQYRKTLHIRLATYDDDPPEGGQGVYCMTLREALSARGVDVRTIAGRGEFAMDVRRLSGRGHIDMSIALNLAPHLLTDESLDVVHFSGGPGGVLFVRRLPIPVVYTAHHTYRQAHSRARLERPMAIAEMRSYRLASAIAAVSVSTADALVKAGVPSRKVVVIPQGIHLPDLRGPSLREPGRIFFVGRLEHEKGVLDALNAMRGVIEKVPGSTAFVAGSGSMEYEVRRVSSSYGGLISYLGRISDEELDRQYRLADIVLMPSKYEGAGIVALEAMARGAVVIGYDVSGLRDTIADNGVLVRPNDVAAVTSACIRLLSDPVQKVELAMRGLESVRRERSIERFGERFEDLYRQVIA